LSVFVALGVVAFVSNRSGASASLGTPTPNMSVFSFQPTDVQTLVIDYNSKSVTVQQDSSGQWQLIVPKAQYSDFDAHCRRGSDPGQHAKGS